MFRIPDDLESRFKFIMLSAKRAEQLSKGARPRVESESKSLVVIAAQEVAEGKVPGLYDEALEEIEDGEEEIGLAGDLESI